MKLIRTEPFATDQLALAVGRKRALVIEACLGRIRHSQSESTARVGTATDISRHRTRSLCRLSGQSFGPLGELAPRKHATYEVVFCSYVCLAILRGLVLQGFLERAYRA